MTTKLVGIKEFRKNIAQLTKRGRRGNLRYIVLNRNTPVFEVRPLNVDDVILENLIQDVGRARQDIKHKKVVSLESAMKEFGL